MRERIFIDTVAFEPLTEGGLRPPQFRISSTSELVQEYIRNAFDDLLPWIHTDGKGVFWYENRDAENRETVAISRPLRPGEPWPSHELIRLENGWNRLLEATENITNQNLRLFLLCFQLPDPNTLPGSYRVYRDAAGKIRLHVLWGFFPRNSRHLSIPMEDVIACLKVDGMKPAPSAIMTTSPPPLPQAALKPNRRAWAIWQAMKSISDTQKT